MDIQFQENGIYLHIHVTDEGDVRLYNLSAMEERLPLAQEGKWFRLVELQGAGFNQNDHHGAKHTGTQPGSLLRYTRHSDTRNPFGRKLKVEQAHFGLIVTSHVQFYDGIRVVRCWTTLHNDSQEAFPLEHLSSFALTGLSKVAPSPRDEKGFVWLAHNTWFGEAQWKRYSLHELGYDAVNDFSMKRVACSSVGTWPASEHLPMGCYENESSGLALVWQIETAGSWHWEISDIDRQLYVQLTGPTHQEHQFYKSVEPGGVFTGVPCAVALVQGAFQDGVRELTQYRRAIRRPNEDSAHPSVIFNDYMNCLMGDPTTEKLLPLIDAAAEVGCRFFCIDAGWYSDGEWWDGVGEWLPSRARFPNGIQEPLQYIRDKGMIPGLWLELEVMGIHCPLAQKVSKDWFFQRNGYPVIDHGRYQLDFRNPEVIKHADGVIERLVREYGAGYIKMDYNINAGVGTELRADSLGDGLLAHTRAYLRWLDDVFARYPALVIENCGSGGMRMEYSLLSRHSIQSVTDQTDYRKMAAIACNCMTAVTPEQAAIWSYPLEQGDEEEVVFNMISAMLLRIHQSGHLAKLSKERLALVKEGIACHLSIVDRLKQGLPFWPIGLGSLADNFLAVGLQCGNVRYVAVWCVNTGGTVQIPVRGARARCLYPAKLPTDFAYHSGQLSVCMQASSARLFEVSE